MDGESNVEDTIKIRWIRHQLRTIIILFEEQEEFLK